MKKLLYLLLLTPIIYLVSCSSGKGDLTPEPLPIEETIVGVTWQLLNVGGGWFRLNDDYTYSTKDYLCDTFAIKGVWLLDGDVIENRYIIGAAEYVERSTIIEYSDSLLKFQADTTPTADVYIWFEACIPEPIRGCMDSTFLNFNSNAQCPDTCTNAPVYGCLDADACNYNALANIDDGNCEYITCAGCMDVNALNYDATNTIDDGSCCYVEGCIDAAALNYNANACQDDGSCCFVEGCMDATALNYNANACQDDGSCLGIGATYQGGIIFYLDGNGGGLISSSSDQSTDAEWGCYGSNLYSIYGVATGYSIGAGQQNTINILSGCFESGIAAKLCDDYTVTYNGVTYNDWFLPSENEMIEMDLNIGPFSQMNNVGNLTANVPYWSSTELSPHSAMPHTMNGNGNQNDVGKSAQLYVRAIRTF